MPIAFDTLAYAQRLKKVGVPEAQAEVQAQTFAEIIDNNLATKTDLKAESNDIRKEILATKTDLKKEIKELELRLIRWFAGFMLAQTGLIAALVKLL